MSLTGTTTVPACLARARAAVEPVLREAVGRLGPELARSASYHMGWTDEAGRPTGDGGKGVRPALAILSAEAVGAPAATGIPGGAAIELVHNFSLLHDDVMDGDRERRHRPTVWALSGVGRAIITGDALLTAAVQILLETAGPTAPAASRRLLAATAAMIEGQEDDMDFESRPDVGIEECRAMEARKTGALLACAASIGAELSDGPAGAVDALDRFGLHLGLAFQAVDDLLGIWGDPRVTGKPAGSDLATAKKSLPVVAALAAEHRGAGELRRLLASGDLDEGARQRAAELVEACGGRAYARRVAEQEMHTADEALGHPGLEPAAVAELRELAAFVVERDF